MTVALYMDVRVHRAITTGLRLRDVDVLTAQEDGHRTAIERPMMIACLTAPQNYDAFYSLKTRIC